MAAAIASEDEAPKKSGSPIVTIAAVAGLSVVAAGGGWLLGSMIAPQKTATADKAAMHVEHDKGKREEAVKKEEISTEANGVVLLQPLTTNLTYPADKWIRLEVSLIFRDKPDVATAEAIHQDLMAYLRTLSLQEIEGARGFEHLRNDLQERARLRSKGRVTTLLIRTFVVE